MQTFKEFLLNEADPMGGMGAPAGGAPLGADPMGGAPMGGGMGMGGPPPMGGGPMDPMGGMGGPSPMGGAPGGGEQVPVHIKNADVWKVLDHLLNNKPLPKEPESPPAVRDQGGMGMDAGGAVGGAPPMGGDMMGGPPMGGGMPGAPSPMGGPPMGGGLMS